jgi:hypothetical protein
VNVEVTVELYLKDDEAKRQWCFSQSINPEHHCCLDMAFAISRPILTPQQGPNRIVDWFLVLKKGGTSPRS